jgi:hypothetical protein
LKRFVVASPILDGWGKGTFMSDSARSLYFRQSLIQMQRDVLDLVEAEGVPAALSIHWEFRTADDVFLWNPQSGVPEGAVELVVVAEVAGFRDGR